MKKLIILLIFLISCITPPKISEQEPEICCLYQDGMQFIFCVDNKIISIIVTSENFFIKGVIGECECDKKEVENENNIRTL